MVFFLIPGVCFAVAFAFISSVPVVSAKLSKKRRIVEDEDDNEEMNDPPPPPYFKLECQDPPPPYSEE